MICGKCGKETNANARFCTQCGAPTGTATPGPVPLPAKPATADETRRMPEVCPTAPAATQSETTRRGKRWLMAVAAFMAVILVATASFLCGVQSGKAQGAAAMRAAMSAQRTNTSGKTTSKKKAESEPTRPTESGSAQKQEQETETNAPKKPDIEGTWVSKGDLDRPFTLNNGVLTTPSVEGEPEKGTYTISDEPDDDGYFVLTLQFDDMSKCSSTSQEECDSDSYLDINRFEIQTDDNSGSYITSFTLRPILSDSDAARVSAGQYYSTCPWDAGYSWMTGDDGEEDVCAVGPDAEPVNPEYWTMIRQ